MDTNIATERAYSADFWSAGEEPAPSARPECKAAFPLNRGEALILVLLLSLGLSAATWGAIALLAMGGRW
jgi:hypothetical protein